MRRFSCDYPFTNSIDRFPVSNLTAAKKLFGAFLGSEPYVDGAYNLGYRLEDLEIGLDPNAGVQGYEALVFIISTYV